MKKQFDNLQPFEKRVVVGVAAMFFIVLNFFSGTLIRGVTKFPPVGSVFDGKLQSIIIILYLRGKISRSEIMITACYQYLQMEVG